MEDRFIRDWTEPTNHYRSIGYLSRPRVAAVQPKYVGMYFGTCVCSTAASGSWGEFRGLEIDLTFLRRTVLRYTLYHAQRVLFNRQYHLGVVHCQNWIALHLQFGFGALDEPRGRSSASLFCIEIVAIQ